MRESGAGYWSSGASNHRNSNAPSRSYDNNDASRSYDSKSSRPYDSGNSSRPYDSGNSSRPYDSGNSSRPYDNNNSSRPYDSSSASRPYDNSNPSRFNDSGMPSRSYDSNNPSRFDSVDPSRSYESKNATRSYDGNNRSKSYDSNNPSRTYDSNNPSRSYDGNSPARPYDGNNPSRPYDSNNQSRSYDRNNSSRSYDGNNTSRSFDGNNPSRSYDRTDYNNGNRPFPPPSTGGFGPSNFDNPPMEPRYGGPGGMGSGPNKNNMGPMRNSGGGVGVGGGIMMGGIGPQGGEIGPPGGMGPPAGNLGMPVLGMGSQGPGGPEAEFLRTLSQMSSHPNDIATKIISAVLSTSLVGNINNQPGPAFPGECLVGNRNNQPGPVFTREISGFKDQNSYPPRRSPRSSRFGPSGFDRYSNERRGFRPSFSEKSYKPRIERQSDFGKRSTDVRKRLAYKRTYDEKPREEHSKFKRQKFSSERNESTHGDERPDEDEEEKDDVALSERSFDTKKDTEGTEKERKSNTEEKDDKDIKDNDKKDKKLADEIPVEALYCHMCDHGNFSSEKTYLFHLEGIRHRKTAIAFHSKNDATLEYLRKNAKLANIRFGSLDNSVTPSKCSICYALVKESFYKHKKLHEHRVVKEFLMPKCCGRFFRTRHDMDEHRLSLPHLKTVYKTNETKKFVMEENISDGEENVLPGDVVELLKAKRNTEEPEKLTLDNLPPFDGNNMIGMNYLEPKKAMQCMTCHLLLPVTAKSVEEHLVSLDHYNALVDHLRKENTIQNKKTDSKDSPVKEREGKGERKRREEKEEESDDESITYLEKELMGISDEEKEKNSDNEEDENLPYIDEDAHIVLEELDDVEEVDNDENNVEEVGKDLDDDIEEVNYETIDDNDKTEEESIVEA